MPRKKTLKPQTSPSKMAVILGHIDAGPSTVVVPDNRYGRFVDLVTNVLATKDCNPVTGTDPSLGYAPRNPVKGEWIYVRWETGGVSGGSCWDTSNAQPYSSGNVPEELIALDYILEALYPNITYLQYKVLAATVIKTDTYSRNEYYGNRSDYALKKVHLRDLFDYMTEKGWISL